ncbi:hypothetical protein ACA910_000553 [Epithemia clementina (nom. ined.)]
MKQYKSFALSSVFALARLANVDAFTVGGASSRQARLTTTTTTSPPTNPLYMADTWEEDKSAVGGGIGSLEQIEFKIYPDGRVEETVRGIKGDNCLSVTEKINQVLGEVVASRPTEEMYEQEIVTDQTLYQKTSNGDWEGRSSW